MSTNPYRASRRFERMSLEIGEQNRLRGRDPEKYREHMRRLTQRRPSTSGGKVISEINYIFDENGNWIDTRIDCQNKERNSD